MKLAVLPGREIDFPQQLVVELRPHVKAGDLVASAALLQLAAHLLEDIGAEVRSVTIYTKPSTIIQPDYAWKDTDLWIDFPWSYKGTVREEDEGLSPRA